MDETKQVKQIPIEEILPNRFQPRINFEEKALNELASSIKQHGIIQPLVVRPLGDKFEIIAGERRYKAATIAGLSSVPAIVTDMDDSTSAEVALVENVQRKDLSAIEEAKSYKNMLDRGNLTQEELAKKMGLSQSTIANKLRLLNLSDEVQKALMDEKISERHARALLSVPNKDDQVRWLNRIINERLTVRQLDLAIKDEMTEKNQPEVVESDIPIVDINPDIESIINNAVDINAPDDKPKIDVFAGLNNNDSNIVIGGEEEQKETVEENNNQNVQASTPMPNKFFNFLEDEEVNMNMEESKEEQNAQVSNQNVFSFAPEFESNTDNNQVETHTEEDKFAQFDAQNQINEPVNEEIEELEVLDSTPIDPAVNNAEVQSNNNEIETLDSIDTLDSEPVVEEKVDNTVQEVVSKEPVDNQVTSEDNDTISLEDVINNDVEIPKGPFETEEEINIEPIPPVEDENIIDPVKLFNTLEPDFYDKVKEYAGLDLKTAINSYRDLTTELSSKGFTISIDEIDEEKNYKITIDINKE